MVFRIIIAYMERAVLKKGKKKGRGPCYGRIQGGTDKVECVGGEPCFQSIVVFGPTFNLQHDGISGKKGKIGG